MAIAAVTPRVRTIVICDDVSASFTETGVFTLECVRSHLEAASGCRVVGWSSRLADRAGLKEDMEGAENYDVLLTELKAAAVDVACERARFVGAEVVFVDNRAVIVEGTADLPTLLRETIELAQERHRDR